MKTLRLLLALLLVPAAVTAQETDAPDGARIGLVRVSGIDEDRLSPGLRADLDALVGQPLDRAKLAELAERIEIERPETVAATRAVKEPNGDASVVFLIARISDDRHLEININSRYTIESVVINGIAETELVQSIRDDLHALSGKRLDSFEMQRLLRRLRRALPGYDVERRVSRGSQRGQVVITFEVSKGEGLRWLHYVPVHSKFLFHENQGWSGLLDIPIGGRSVRVTPRFAFDNKDDLVEEYSGAGVRVETRMFDNERFGISFEASRYEPSWEAETLAALAANPRSPGAYDRRSTIAPGASFAFTPHIRASAGLSVTSLLYPVSRTSTRAEMASAFTASAGYDDRWNVGDSASHAVEAGFDLRVGTDSLGGDLNYERFVGRGLYRFRHDERQTFIVTGMAGGISGDAPLFERFTLGDSSTLRGWDKYDIAPFGGTAMFHTSVEYRYWGLAFFLDTGAVWERGGDQKVRSSTGVGLHFDNFFATFGFPLNAESVGATFMIGVRF